MALGFKGATAIAGFVPAMRVGSRRMETDGHERVGQVAAQVGARTRGTLPAQAQVAACAREKKRAEPFLRFWAESGGARATRLGRGKLGRLRCPRPKWPNK